MIVLSATTDKLQAVLAAVVTTSQLDCVASWRDITTTTYTPGRTLSTTNSTTDADIVPAPDASTQRVIDFVSICNTDTVSHTVKVKLDASGTDYVLFVGTIAAGQTITYVEGAGWSVTVGNASVGYAINVQALTSSPTDAQTVYFGTLPKAPVTVAATSKIYIPRSGVLKRAEIYCYSGTAGTAESWSLYVRHQNTTDYLIATLAVSASERIFSNNALSIAVSAGDYIEIKGIQPTWATNPLTTIYGGYVYIE